jgi:hypothetical protein
MTATLRSSPLALAAPRLSAPGRWRAMLLICAIAIAAAAAAVAIVTTTGAVSARAAEEPDWARLMLGMAAIKALLAAAAAAVLWWRLGQPIGKPLAAAYIGGLSLMAGSTAAMAMLAAIPVAAIAFHAGEITLLLLAWRDGAGRLR